MRIGGVVNPKPKYPLDQLFSYLAFNMDSTLYRSYHDGWFYKQRKAAHTVDQGPVLYTADHR